MEFRSQAFENGGNIPRRFTCEGVDVSPPLRWSDAPSQTRAFALICEDPDAPLKTFVHWVLYDMPGTQTTLMEGRPKEPTLLGGAKQGKNGFGRIGYGGPCPPTGPEHRYFFKLYALDRPLGLEAGASRRDVEEAMQGHVLAQAELMGRYRKVRLRTFVKALLGR